MTPDEVIAEYHRTIAEYDRLHAPCPIEQRKRRREAEQQQRQIQEARRIEHQAQTQAQWHAWFLEELNAALLDKQHCAFIATIGQVIGETRAGLRKDYEAKIAVLETRLKDLEHHHSLNQQFYELERRLDARQLARDEVKRGSEMIPQSQLPEIEKLQRQIDDLKKVADPDARFLELAERVYELEKTNSLEARFTKLANEAKRGSEISQAELLEKIEGLQRQVVDLKSVADLDVRCRELAERVGELEKTNSLEARFNELANEAKRGSEMISQSQLLLKIEKLQRQVDDLKRVADPDVRFRELSERIGELEKTYGLEARFATLASKVKHEPAIPKDELLAKFEGLQRQVDELKSVADLDSGFCDLTQRVGELEKTTNLEARFAKLAHEVKSGSELPQSELLPRIIELERRLDDFKKIANQPGPQGPPGKDARLPIAKVFQKDTVYYTGDVVTCDGSTYQALRDTGQNVNHADWVCLARAGRDGCHGRSPNVCGAYDAREKYERLDIIALDGVAFIARRDNPGVCPGDDWQLMSRQGRQGRPGETGDRGPRGEKGERGEPGATIHSWQLDRKRYCISPLMSDGKVGPMLELRPMFEQFLAEVAS